VLFRSAGIDMALFCYWQDAKMSSRLRPHIRGGIVENEGAAELYRRAKIGLNLYRTLVAFDRKHEQHVTNAESLNPRAVELAACGTFSISDWRPEVAEVFGDAVPTFKTPAELGDLCRYYLAHDDRRQELAARLPGCVAGHTYSNRTKQLLGILENV
jgi:spore maturation protein CgeB